MNKSLLLMLVYGFMTALIVADEVPMPQTQQQYEDEVCDQLKRIFATYECYNNPRDYRSPYIYDSFEIQKKMEPIRQLMCNESTPLSLKIKLAKVFYEKPEISNKELLRKYDYETFKLVTRRGYLEGLKTVCYILDHGTTAQEMALAGIFDKARKNEIDGHELKEQLQPYKQELQKAYGKRDVMLYGRSSKKSHELRLEEILLHVREGHMSGLKEHDPETYGVVQSFANKRWPIWWKLTELQNKGFEFLAKCVRALY